MTATDTDTRVAEPTLPRRTATRRAVAPLARLAFRRAEREWRNSLLLVAAIALPVGFGSLIVPVAVGPDPLALIFTMMVAAVIALSVGAVLAVSTGSRLDQRSMRTRIGPMRRWTPTKTAMTASISPPGLKLATRQ